jgi:hypothetical protein
MQVTAPDGVYLPALGRPVEKGETVDVPEDVAASLLEQGWDVPSGGPTKAELLDVAESLGVDAKKSWTVQQITDAIEAHAQPEPDPATAEQED